jgi:2-polyprenyl-3-methyl-5-hydroxy-6-metoxy-1,4-benzoquinol methylase
MRLCPVCAHPAAVNVGELENTKYAPLERTHYDLLHCRECDIVYLSPLPTARDLEILYIDELQFDYHTEEQIRAVVDFMTGRLRAVLERMGMAGRGRPLLEKAGLRKPRVDKLAVLEIGAGLAWMARAAKGIAPRARTVAQDITPEAAEKCPWVDRYIVGAAEDARIDALGPFDVISLTHVIEHVPDPVAMLRRLRPITRGRIFITAPHRPVRWDGGIESWRAYSYNHVPGHLQYLSERGMRKAAEAAGFTLDFWDGTSEDGQAFEAWLKPAQA